MLAGDFSCRISRGAQSDPSALQDYDAFSVFSQKICGQYARQPAADYRGIRLQIPVKGWKFRGVIFF